MISQIPPNRSRRPARATLAIKGEPELTASDLARYQYLESGAKGTRTPDPLLAKQVLFQLSYSPAPRRFKGTRSAPAQRAAELRLSVRGVAPAKQSRAGQIQAAPPAQTQAGPPTQTQAANRAQQAQQTRASPAPDRPPQPALPEAQQSCPADGSRPPAVAGRGCDLRSGSPPRSGPRPAGRTGCRFRCLLRRRSRGHR